jgi:heat shock protein HslJ
VSVLGKLLILLATACLGSRGAEDPLSGTAWELMFYRKSSVIAGTSTTVIFEGGQVHGSAGCNSYSGTYQVNGDQITIGPLVITEMACLEPDGLMDQEVLFMEYMSTVRTIKFVDDQLQLVRPDRETLTFVTAQ